MDLQACLRRLVKRTMYCELFPWCAGAPLHPADRMRLPVSHVKSTVVIFVQRRTKVLSVM